MANANDQGLTGREGRGREVRVLVVDDVPEHVLLIRRFLARSRNPRMVVETTSDPQEAVARILAEPFDAILLDYRLPGRSGLDVLREINRDGRKPVIILTNQGDERTAVEFFHAGAYDYLLKDMAPGFAETLRLTIRELLTRREFERQIERERRRSSAILESMTQMVCCLDPEFRITAANRAFRWLVRGYVPDGAQRGLPDPVGLTVGEIIHDPRIRDTQLASLSRVLTQGAVLQEEIEIVVHGQQRFFWAEAAPLLVDGAIEGITLALTDLTEQRSARRDQLRLARAVDSTGDGIAITDVDGSIEYANPAYTHMTGYRADELIGAPAPFLRRAMGNSVPGALWDRIARGEEWHGELVNRRKDASIYFADTRIAPIRDDAGSLIGFVSAERDVTDRKLFTDELIKAREAAEESLRAKDMFLATVSHELRTPLTSIIGYADLILMDPNLSESGRQFAESILRGGRTLKQLITNILDFSRIAAGKFYLDLQPVDVRAMAGELITMFRNVPGGDNGTLTLEVVPELPERILLDRMKVEQVLSNLISNAMKYAGAGEIRVSVGPLFERTEEDAAVPAAPGMLVFAVKDEGPGIGPQEQERIFEPFVQLEEGLVRRHGGAGLGLSIARRLTELMGGTIWVESAEGEGACFSFALPMAVPRQEGVVPANTASGGAVILVVRPPGIALPEEAELLAWGYDVRPVAGSAADRSSIAGDHVQERGPAAVLVASQAGLGCVFEAVEHISRRIGPQVPCFVHVSGEDRVWEPLGWVTHLGRLRDDAAAASLVQRLEEWRPMSRCVLVDPADPLARRWAQDAIGPRGVRVEFATDDVIAGLEGVSDEIVLLVVDIARDPRAALSLWQRSLDMIPRLVLGVLGWDPSASLPLEAAWASLAPGFRRERARRTRWVLNAVHTLLSTGRDRNGAQKRGGAPWAVSPWSPPGLSRPVLVVEDHTENRALVSEMVRAMGLPCHSVGSGAEAVAFVGSELPCLVLMDIEMPGMDGYQATRAIHRLPGREHLPVVALTAHVSPQDRRLCHEAGCVDFVPKPIERTDLTRILRRWVSAGEMDVEDALPGDCRAERASG